jgi:type IV secretion/conjugal transfer VirB4 family ATPase
MRVVGVSTRREGGSSDALYLSSLAAVQKLLPGSFNALEGESTQMEMNFYNSVIVVISGVGFLFVALLWDRLRVVNRTRMLKHHRSRREGLCDLLNLAACVSPGVVIGKNGALIAGFEYVGNDNASLTDAEKDAVSVRLNQALVRLGSGWMLHLDSVRSEVDPYKNQHSDYFPDRISKAIDEERREFFSRPGAAFQSKFILCVSYLPPSKTVRKLSELIYEDNTRKTDPRAEAQNTLQMFERELSNLENRLSSSFHLKRLGPRKQITEDGREVIFDDLLSHLQFCVTGIRQPVRLPRHAYLDAVIGGQEMYGGVLPKIGRNYLQVVAIEGFPHESYGGMLTSLGELPVGYRWSSRFIFLEPWESLGHLARFRKRWQTAVTPFLAQVLNLKTDNINEDAAAMVADANSASTHISGGVVSAGYYTSNLHFFGEDRRQVEHFARQAEKAVNNLGFTARVETINTMDAWLGSIPGHGNENIRRPLLNTMNLADLLPVSSIWQGSATAPCPYYPKNSPALAHVLTTGQTSFDLNLHVRDVAHTFVAGPTGFGKSTLLGFLIAQLRRYPEMKVFVFDKGMSQYAYCQAAGGSHYHIGSDDATLSFCPLKRLDKYQDRMWACHWIDRICELNGLVTTASQRNAIGSAIVSMNDGNHRTITDFCSSVQDTAIQEVMHEYTLSGSLGNLFDAKSDSIGLDNFTVFEIESLMSMAPKYGLPILLYLFRMIDRDMAANPPPSAIVLDEAWLMLGHPVFRAKIAEWLRTMRKANCAVIMATQSVSDAIDCGIMPVLIESTATKIFLPNPNARDEQGGKMYRRFGLNEREIEIIANAIPKREYYVRTDEHQRLVDLELGPLSLAFIGVSDKESVAAVKRCEAEFGEEWVTEWMRIKGVNSGFDNIKPSSAVVNRKEFNEVC